MNTVIFRTVVPGLSALMLMFSVFVLLRGHNGPGGGFIGGLIAAAAVALYGISAGVEEVRKAMWFDPLAVAGSGVVLAAFTGVLSLFHQAPFMTGLWITLHFGEVAVTVSTPMFFDIGVYLVVLGTISAVALALEEPEGSA
jgi:multicomponent Na+:H+ antiporter subunit B